MKKRLHKLFFCLTVAAMIAGLANIPAEGYENAGNHWSTPYRKVLLDKGIMTQSEYNAAPETPVSHTLMGNWINLILFGRENNLTEMLSDYNDDTLLSRGEAFALVADTFNLPEADIEVLRQFSDYDDIPLALKPQLARLVQASIVNGHGSGSQEGTLDVYSSITLSEASALLTLCAGEIFSTPGLYNMPHTLKNAVINKDGITLQNAEISGHLYLSEGLGDGNVTMNNSRVAGRLTIRGGGIHSIYLNGCVIGEISICKSDGAVRVVSSDGNDCPFVFVDDGKDAVYLSGFYTEVMINTSVPVYFQDGSIEKITINAEEAAITLSDTASAGEISVMPSANRTTLYVDGIVDYLNYTADDGIIYQTGIVMQTSLSGNNITYNTTEDVAEVEPPAPHEPVTVSQTIPQMSSSTGSRVSRNVSNTDKPSEDVITDGENDSDHDADDNRDTDSYYGENNSDGNGTPNNNGEDNTGSGTPDNNGEDDTDSGTPDNNGEDDTDSGTPDNNGEDDIDSGTLDNNSENNTDSGTPDNNSENNTDSGTPDNNSENNTNSGTPDNNSENNTDSGTPDNNSENNTDSGTLDNNSENNTDSGTPDNNGDDDTDDGTPDNNGEDDTDDGTPDNNGEDDTDDGTPDNNGEDDTDDGTPNNNGDDDTDDGTPDDNGDDDTDNGTPDDNGDDDTDNGTPDDNGEDDTDDGTPDDNGDDDTDNGTPDDNGDDDTDNGTPDDNGDDDTDNRTPDDNGDDDTDDGTPDDNGDDDTDDGTPDDNGDDDTDNGTPNNNGEDDTDNGTPDNNGDDDTDDGTPDNNGDDDTDDGTPDNNGDDDHIEPVDPLDFEDLLALSGQNVYTLYSAESGNSDNLIRSSKDSKLYRWPVQNAGGINKLYRDLFTSLKDGDDFIVEDGRVTEVIINHSNPVTFDKLDFRSLNYELTIRNPKGNILTLSNAIGLAEAPKINNIKHAKLTIAGSGHVKLVNIANDAYINLSGELSLEAKDLSGILFVYLTGSNTRVNIDSPVGQYVFISFNNAKDKATAVFDGVTIFGNHQFGYTTSVIRSKSGASVSLNSDSTMGNDFMFAFNLPKNNLSNTEITVEDSLVTLKGAPAGSIMGGSYLPDGMRFDILNSSLQIMSLTGNSSAQSLLLPLISLDNESVVSVIGYNGPFFYLKEGAMANNNHLEPGEYQWIYNKSYWLKKE